MGERRFGNNTWEKLELLKDSVVDKIQEGSGERGRAPRIPVGEKVPHSLAKANHLKSCTEDGPEAWLPSDCGAPGI